MSGFKEALQTAVFFFLFAFLLLCCGKQEEVAPAKDDPELLACGIDQTDNVSSLTATLNGSKIYCPTVVGGSPGLIICMVNQPAYEVKVDSVLNIGIFALEPKENTYTVKDGAVYVRFNKYVYSVQSEEVYYKAILDNEFESSGTFIIEELTAEYMKGTFEFVLAPFYEGTDEPAGGPDLVITDGRFNIYIGEE